MPVPELMTWIPSQRRWTKCYCGKRYYISARKLGCPETKEDSVQAANQWWRDRQAEIDYALRVQKRAPRPLEDIAAASMGVPADLFGNVRLLLEQALMNEEEKRKRGEPLAKAFPGLPDDAEAEIAIDDDEPEDAETVRRREVMTLLERLLFGDEGQALNNLAKQLPPARVHQVEKAVRLLRDDGLAVDPKRSIKERSEDWLRKQKLRATGKQITALRYKNLQNYLGHFVSFIGESSDVSRINEEMVESFHNYCLGKIGEKGAGIASGWGTEHAKKVFVTAQRFIRWLWECGTIPLPKNLDSENYKFRIDTKSVPTWTIEEVCHVIGEAPGKLRLALLLMINCGMTQADVSDLADGEVDWTRGIITRRRSKTKHGKNVPVVSYPLWPLTWELLREYRSGDKDHVLLTQTGRPFVRSEIIDGKVKQADMIIAKYRKLRKRLKFSKPLKQLRKTSASLLESHPVYGRLTSLFLGHAPASIKEKHYAAAPQDLFNEAVTWLGQQYGFVDTNA